MEKGRVLLFIRLSIMFWLYTALQYRSSWSSNFFVFHTSGCISSRPACFLVLIFISTTSSYFWVNCPTLMSRCLSIIFAIALSVIPGNFASRLLKRSSRMCIITLPFIAAKIYKALLLNRIELEIEKILRQNQNGFRRNQSTISQILIIICRILEGARALNLEMLLSFVDFSKSFDSIHRGKMEQMLLEYGLPKETLTAIMMLYKNTKVKVRSSDGDTDFFDIVAGVLQGDTLALYVFIICLDNVLWTKIDLKEENGFTLEKARSKRYPAQTITDAHYVDEILLPANIPT